MVTVTMLTIYWYKLTRAVFTVAPVLYALAAEGIASRLDDPSPRWRKAAFISLIICLLHLPMAFLPGSMLKYHPAMRQEASHMLNFDVGLQSAIENVAKEAGDLGPVGIVGDFHAVNTLFVRCSFQTMAQGSAKNAFSLLNWSKPMEQINLAQIMKNAEVPIALVIRVVPGSRYDNEDYRDNYAWMTENLISIDADSSMTKIHETIYNRSVSFELWKIHGQGSPSR